MTYFYTKNLDEQFNLKRNKILNLGTRLTANELVENDISKMKIKSYVILFYNNEVKDYNTVIDKVPNSILNTLFLDYKKLP